MATSNSKSLLNTPYQVRTTVSSIPGTMVESLKAAKLTKATVPETVMNQANSPEYICALHNHNTYVESMTGITNGLSNTQVAAAILKTQDYKGHIFPDLSPLGKRVELDTQWNTKLSGGDQ